MTEQEQQVWLGIFNAALPKTYNNVVGNVAKSVAEAASAADSGLEEFRARAHPRRSLWARLFGGAQKTERPVYVLHVELPQEPDESAEPEKLFRAMVDGKPTQVGDLKQCLRTATMNRGFGSDATLQASTDNGRTWADVGDDGEPLPPPQPVEEPKCAFVREPEKSASPAASKPPPPADAAEDSTPEDGA